MATDAPALTAPPDLEDPSLYLNRELSLLAFQWRVLAEACDAGNPLLERVKFLAIVASNLDEFFMVRVGGLRRQIAAGFAELPPDGMTPAEQLAAVRKEAVRLMTAMRDCLLGELIPALAKNGIHLLDLADLSKKDRTLVQRYFDQLIYPVLTPLAHDPGRPFPHISNLSLNLAILIRDAQGRQRFARLKVPATLPRLVPVEDGTTSRRGEAPRERRFVWIEQVIAANLGALFPGTKITAAVGSSRVDLQACKLEYSIVSPK